MEDVLKLIDDRFAKYNSENLVNRNHLARIQRSLDHFTKTTDISKNSCVYKCGVDTSHQLQRLEVEPEDEEKRSHYVSYFLIISTIACIYTLFPESILRRKWRKEKQIVAYFRQIVSDKCIFEYNVAGGQGKKPLKELRNLIQCFGKCC